MWDLSLMLHFAALISGIAFLTAIMLFTFLPLAVFVAVAAAQFSTTTQSTESCPAALPRDQYLVVNNGICYEFVMYRQRAYSSAENDCKINGGTLVVIPDQATQNFVLSKIRELYSGSEGVWIGLHDRNSEGTFTWPDGSAAVYENWGSNDGPNNYFSAPFTDCVAIDPISGDWEDFQCGGDILSIFSDVEHPYICQFS